MISIRSNRLSTMKPNTGARMVSNALTMQEWTCRKEILLSQKYTFTLRQQGVNKEFKQQFFFEMNSSLGSFLLHYIGNGRVSLP